MTLADLTEAEATRLRQDLVVVLQALRAWLKVELARAATKDGEPVISRELGVELAAKLARQASDLLAGFGWDRATRRAAEGFRAAAEAALGQVPGDGLGPSMATLDAETLRRFADGTVDRILSLKGEAGERLRRLTLEASQAQVTPERALTELARAMAGTVAEAVSEFATGLMGLGRVAMYEGSKRAGIDLFVYEGPEDGITRPFCSLYVGRIVTTQDLDRADNHQGLRPTSVYLGGYNCRHSLAPITVEQAIEMVQDEGPDQAIGPGCRVARSILIDGATGPNEAAFRKRLTRRAAG